MKVRKSKVDFCGVVIICITAAEIEVAEENKVTEFSGVRSMEGIWFLSFGFLCGCWSIAIAEYVSHELNGYS